MSEANEAEITAEEVLLLESEENRNAVEHLAKDPRFITFMAYWLTYAGELPDGVIDESHLQLANFQIGRMSQLNDFMSNLQRVHNAAYLNIQSEVNKYGQRRLRAEQRIDDGADD